MGNAEGSSSWFSRFSWIVPVIAVALVGVALPAGASVRPADAEDSAGNAGIQLLEKRISVEDGASYALWPWPEGHLGFQLAAAGDAVVAYDLDTNQQVARQTLSPGAPRLGNTNYASGHTFLGAVDRVEGRLFVAYRRQAPTPFGLNAAQITDSVGAVVKSGEVCTPMVNAPDCIGGVTMLDARTLEVQRAIPLPLLRVDGGPTHGLIRAVTFSPAKPGGGDADGAKLHLVVEDIIANPLAASPEPRGLGANVVYAVQLDVDSGREDWALRLDGCRNAREVDGERSLTSKRGHPATIYRSLVRDEVVVGCHGTKGAGVVVRIPLDAQGAPASVPVGLGDPAANLGTFVETQGDGAGPQTFVVSKATPLAIPGPESVVEILADPGSDRTLMRVLGGSPRAEVWWVFDAVKGEFIGTIGIGSYWESHTTNGIDPDTGRLYVLGAKTTKAPGGLYVADVRRTPIPQALYYGQFSDLATIPVDIELGVESAYDGRGVRVYFRQMPPSGATGNELLTPYRVIEDRTPIAPDAVTIDSSARTLDIDEREGVTESAFDAAARGYGFRMLLVGGFEAAARIAVADATIGRQLAANTSAVGVDDVLPLVRPLIQDPCGRVNRDMTIASIGPLAPVVVDGNGSRAAAEPLVLDSSLQADTEKPFSRCSPLDWQNVWTAALFGRPPADEPEVPSVTGASRVECLSTTETPSATFSDPVLGRFAAKVDCGDEQTQGWSHVRMVDVGGVTVGEVGSQFSVYRDPGRGIVARVESVARGIDLAGQVHIDSVRTVAESWANGRRSSVPDASDDPATFAYNCNSERQAGTCFIRSVMGVSTPFYRCGPCGDEQALADQLNKALGTNGRVRLRQPDRQLARGADNGFAAAIQKSDHERFADLVLNNDLLQTVVPGLEIIRYAPPGAISTGEKGRQIFQFAGVEVSSSYGISCLLVYDEASNTCAAAKEEAGSITVNLTDSDGKALAGGAFEVRTDADTDGVVGLKDALLPNGACVTTDDGVGTCKFDALQPGSYLVSQVAAPPGYGKVADPFVVELASGEARTVTFQNTSNVSTIQVSAADEAGKPVSGAQFAVFADPDSDGKVAGDAKPAATCTTDASGSCSMQVPAGSYVLVQTSAPGGLEPIEPVAFTFASGGQTAAVGVVNYPAGGVPPVEPAAGPVEYSAPPAAVVTETVDEYTPTAEVADEPRVSIPDAVGGTIVRVIQAPGDALRLLARDPKQAVAWTASLLLLAMAVMAVRRRRQAMSLLTG